MPETGEGGYALTHGVFDHLVIVCDDVAIDGLEEWPCTGFILQIIQDKLEIHVIRIPLWLSHPERGRKSVPVFETFGDDLHFIEVGIPATFS